jgi:N-acyl amino acid synthase of PEP-CTERM/exosortase system
MLHSQTAEKGQLSFVRNSELSDAYHRWFEVIPADTPALREQAYRLRYQVYCCENQYETPEEHSRHMEMDDFDCRSIHSLIIDRANGIPTGTVRLILPEAESCEASLPIQQICKHPLPLNLSMSTVAEISRFAISKKMIKMSSEDCPKDLKCSVALGLMKAVVQTSLRYGITDWLAVMEPSLLRLLCRFGIYFTPLGPLVEYHGLRQPCHANVDSMLERVLQVNPALGKFVSEPRSLTITEEAIAANF